MLNPPTILSTSPATMAKRLSTTGTTASSSVLRFPTKGPRNESVAAAEARSAPSESYTVTRRGPKTQSGLTQAERSDNLVQSASNLLDDAGQFSR